MSRFYVLASLVVLGVYLYLNYPEISQTTPKLTFTEFASKPSAGPEDLSEIEDTDSFGTGATFLVTRVIDGDTIEIEGGERIRYIGIDTPESTTSTECYGQAASAENKSLVLGERVVLEKDVSETDRYGRLLRYVYIGEVMVNEYLVSNGYANASSYPPDVKYQERFRVAERLAREAGEGLWSQCGPDQTSNSPNTLNSPTDCPVKGNISKSTDERIYHVPGGKFYNQTVIGDLAGKQCFNTESEAISSGWRKSKL